MKSALLKDSIKEIKNTYKRFLSILVMAFLGVGFFAGMRAASPDMVDTIDQYYKESQVYDIKILSTLGLTNDDIDALSEIDEIENTVGTYETESKIEIDNKEIIKSRIKKLLIAYMNTILDIEGAMCSTNMPHLKGVSGVLIEKTSAKQLMSKYSPLNDDYKKVHLNIDLNDEQSTNKLELNNISLAEGREFNNVQEFIKTIDYILDDEYLDFMIERNMKYVKETFKENK